MAEDDDRKIGAVLLRGSWALLEKCTIAYRLRERAARQFRDELREAGYEIVKG